MDTLFNINEIPHLEFITFGPHEAAECRKEAISSNAGFSFEFERASISCKDSHSILKGIFTHRWKSLWPVLHLNENPYLKRKSSMPL